MPDASTTTEPVGYEVDDLYVDLGRQRVSRAGAELPLSALSFDLLLALVRAAPNLLSYDQLMQQVWPGLVVSPETVSQRVKLVRDALGDDAQAPRYIVGVRGRGYRLIARAVAVMRDPRAPAAAPVSAPVPPAATDAARDAISPTADARPAPALAGFDSVPPPPASAPHADVPPAAPRPARSRLPVVALATAIVVAVAAVVGWRLLPGRVAPVGPEVPASTNAPHGAGPSVVVERPRRTIAVLPLLDLSAGGAGAYVGDGLAEELGIRLANVPGLHVAARSSAFAYRDRQGDVREIGRTLGVKHVIEGSVRRDGNRIRVTAQLVDTETGYNVWAQSYDRPWRDVLAIQDELARSIVDALQIVLSRDTEQRLAATTRDPGAFQQYLAGLGALRQPRSAEQLVAAERAFRDAIALDPTFARAHAGLCETYTLQYERSRTPDVATRADGACAAAAKLDAGSVDVQRAVGRLQLALGRHEQAIATFRAAIAQNPDAADSYVGLGRAYDGANRAADAEQAYQRAIAAEPGYWQPYAAYGAFLVARGRPTEAAQQYRRLIELAPNNASAFNNLGAALQLGGDWKGAADAFERSLAIQPTAFAYSNVGTSYYYLGRYDEAVAMFRRAAAASPDIGAVWGNLADAFAAAGRRDDARDSYRRAAASAEKSLAINPKDGEERAMLAVCYAALGDRVRAEAAVRRALEDRPESPDVHAKAARAALLLGERDRAIDALALAVRHGYPAAFLRQGPEFAALRADPRFTSLVGTAPTG